MERRSDIHLDQITYVLNLPNKERYASYLLSYEVSRPGFLNLELDLLGFLIIFRKGFIKKSL